MVYVTVKAPPMYRQMSIEDLLFGNPYDSTVINANEANTRTLCCKELSPRVASRVDVNRLITTLQLFNESTAQLRAADRQSLYTTFYIPKKSGHGYRKINAPCDELMNALRRLKNILEVDFGALYHTSAFAYISNRCTVDAVKKHQDNKSRWFGKFDFHDFFGSTTMGFVMQQFSVIFPFSEVMKTQEGDSALRTAISLAFLNGGLPQGTPLSPTITNIMMIPIDFKLANKFRDFDGQNFVYTRYADDMIISSRRHFDCAEVERFIIQVLKEENAPFKLNKEKTRYGSSNGQNFNLGIMLNQRNELTVGYKKKREFKAMLSNYIMDYKNGTPWGIEDVRILEGHRNYYRMIEPEVIDKIVSEIAEKYQVNVIKMIKHDLKN